MGDPTAGGPVDAPGIPLARRDYPVTLPKIGDPVKAGQAREGRRAAGLQLRRLPQPGGHQGLRQAGGRERPGDDVQLARRGVHEALDRAASSSTSSSRRPTTCRGWSAGGCIQPLNLDLVPNLQDRGVAGAADPVLRRRPALQRSRTRSTRPGSAGATTRSGDFDPNELGWESFWKAQALRGKVGVLDDAREGIGMALMRRGVTDLNTEDPALLKRASDDLKELNDIARVKVTITGYETLPAGPHVDEPGLVGRHAQRGHLLPARGDDRRRALVLVPEGRRADLQRLHLRRRRGARSR